MGFHDVREGVLDVLAQGAILVFHPVFVNRLPVLLVVEQKQCELWELEPVRPAGASHSTLEHTGAAAAGFKQTTESSAVVEADGDKGKYLRICLLSSSPGRVRGSASSARLMPSLFRETRWPSRELYTTLLQKPRIRTRA
jgi:hypothetical protein